MKLRWKLAQAVEIRWWERYLRHKTRKDYLAWKKGYWERFIGILELSFRSEDKMLDVGCGPAGIFMAFPESRMDAVDPLLEKYERHLAHFKKDDYPNTRFFELPFEQFESSKKYDKVFCLNAINHVESLDGCLKKLAILLKPEGQLILSVDVHNFLIFKYLLRLLPGDILHPHQYDLKEYKRLLSENNFKIQNNLLFKKGFLFDYHIIIATI